MQKVILIGNLGKDPEVKSFENGGKIVNFTVGVTERGYKTKEGKEISDHTEWFNCSVRQNGLAGVVEQYVKKGNKVYVEGRLRTREYEKDGQKFYTTDVIADRVEFLNGVETGGSEQKEMDIPPQFATIKEDVPF